MAAGKLRKVHFSFQNLKLKQTGSIPMSLSCSLHGVPSRSARIWSFQKILSMRKPISVKLPAFRSCFEKEVGSTISLHDFSCSSGSFMTGTTTTKKNVILSNLSWSRADQSIFKVVKRQHSANRQRYEINKYEQMCSC